MFAKLLIFFLSAVVAVGQKVTAVSFGLLDSNGTAVDPGETPASLMIGFTTTSAGTNTVSIGLPSGLVSGDGTFSTGNRRRLDEEEDSDFYGDSFGRRLAVTCEPYGTATVSGGGATLTVQVRVPGTASDPCTAGSAISMSLTGNTATFTSVSTGTLAFTLSTNVDGDPVGISYTVDSTPGANVVVIGDPITWFNGMKYKFWLPVGQMMPLLETAEMTVWASTFQGPNLDYQWFDRFKVTDKDGAELVDIKVNRVLPGSNRSQFHNNFNQLDIMMSGKPIRRRGEQLFGVNGDSKPVRVGVGARRVNPPRFHHSPILEFVMVESDSISFMVHGSHAGAEFPGDFEKQVKYTHLDWVTLDMVDPKENGWKGILPQIWQIQPRTVEVEDLLVAPSKKQMTETLQVCTATE